MGNEVTESTADTHVIVEDVVLALTGDGTETPSSETLRFQMERAAEEFDRRTALAFGNALLDSLCEDPSNLRQLEALLILGLVHPEVLRKNQISIAVEGRRLAILLERAGELDRARGVLELLAHHLPEERTIDHELAGILRRSGNTEELVDRYLQRAELSVEQGNISEAIPWLQEVLLLDRTRRDVARMIRDLRYQESERLVKNKRRNRLLIFVVLLSFAITAVLAREFNVNREFKALPPAIPGDINSTQVRLGKLEDFISDKWVWMGLVDAVKERDRLRDDITEFERDKKQELEEAAKNRRRLAEMAEAARVRGLRHVERDEFEEALVDFKSALRMASDDWEHRGRVQADIAALEQHLGKK